MSTDQKRLLLIDGHSMAYRAFYALPAENFKTSSGQPTNAIYGFASMLINLIKEEQPSHIAVAFDVSRKTFRTELFPEYKANRASTPDEFRSQMSFVNEMIDCFGIKHFEMEGYEADDIIATFAKSAEKNGYQVLICTGDRDSFQLVNSNTTVLYPKKGVTEMSRMTPDAVLEKYGLTPAQYPDFAALRGDPSDNLPSVPGVGEKTATKWISDYGNLEKLLANAQEITGKVGDSLRANVDAIKLNRELTQLLDDLDLKVQIKDLSWLGFDSNLMSNFFEKMEIRALKERLKSLPQAGGAVTKEVSIKVSEISAEEISKLLDKHTKPIAIAFDYEDETLLGYSVATSNTEVYYVQGSKIGDWISKPQLAKYVHSAKVALKNLGLSGVQSDIELLAYLCNPGSRNLSLSDLAERILGEVANSEDLFSQFDPKQAAWIFELQKELSSEVKSKGMISLYEDLEQPTLLLLSQIEEIGIAVDQGKLNQLSAHFTKIVADETAMAHKEAGHEFNVSSPKQLQVVLFKAT